VITCGARLAERQKKRRILLFLKKKKQKDFSVSQLDMPFGLYAGGS
jgi:hypothetical protein